MSGSGGFYKYRCKFFYTHNCPNWVWVNGAPCAMCLAEGREANEAMTASPARQMSRDVCVPQVFHGNLQYTLMRVIESGNDWALMRQKATQQPLITTNMMTTTDTPRPVMASTGIPTHVLSGY